jgi:hypothetical protein
LKSCKFTRWQLDGRDGVVDVVKAPLVVAVLDQVLIEVDAGIFTLTLKKCLSSLKGAIIDNIPR